MARPGFEAAPGGIWPRLARMEREMEVLRRGDEEALDILRRGLARRASPPALVYVSALDPEIGGADVAFALAERVFGARDRDGTGR